MSNHHSFGERSTVVSALAADREHSIALPRDEHWLPISVSSDHSAIRDLVELDSLP